MSQLDTGNPQVRLPEDVVDAIEAAQKDEETRGEAARRLFDDAGYLD